MDIVRSDIFNSILCGKLQNDSIHPLLILIHLGIAARISALMQLHLKVIIVSENLLKFLHYRFGFSPIAMHDGLGQLASQTGRTTDNPFVISAQQLLIYARMIIVTLRKCIRDHLGQIVVACLVFGQKNQVMSPIFTSPFFVKTAARCDIHLTTQNRFDTLFDRCIVKLFHSEHIAVVGNGECRHTKGIGPLQKRFDGRGSIQNRILCMYMKMNKLTHKTSFPNSLAKITKPDTSPNSCVAKFTLRMITLRPADT